MRGLTRFLTLHVFINKTWVGVGFGEWSCDIGGLDWMVRVDWCEIGSDFWFVCLFVAFGCR